MAIKLTLDEAKTYGGNGVLAACNYMSQHDKIYALPYEMKERKPDMRFKKDWNEFISECEDAGNLHVECEDSTIVYILKLRR